MDCPDGMKPVLETEFDEAMNDLKAVEHCCPDCDEFTHPKHGKLLGVRTSDGDHFILYGLEDDYPGDVAA